MKRLKAYFLIKATREELETAKPPASYTEDTHYEAMLYLAKFFLAELDEKPSDWKPDTKRGLVLGEELWNECKDKLPTNFRTEVTGFQVSAAASLAYNAWKREHE